MPSLDDEADEGDEEDEETEDEDKEWEGGSGEGKTTKTVGSELNPRQGLNTTSWTPSNSSPASDPEPTLPKVCVLSLTSRSRIYIDHSLACSFT